MAQLSQDDFGKWKSAFMGAFTTTGSMESLARLARSKSLDQLALGGNLEEITEKLIKRAESENWLGKLIQVACDLSPGVDELAQLKQDYAPSAAAEQMDHFEAAFLYPRAKMPFIHRPELRDALRELAAPIGYRILVVDGEPISGKTYTTSFISYLKRMRGNFDYALIDLERLSQSPPVMVRPDVVGLSIANQLKLSGMPEYGEEQASTWARSYCDWLTGELADQSTPAWIVIDGFHKALVEQGIHDLIYELGWRVNQNLTMVRLVLISYHKDNQDALTTKGASFWPERVPPIRKPELMEFFDRFYAQINGAADKEALEMKVRTSVRRVLHAVKTHADHPRPLQILNEAVTAEAKDILLKASKQASGVETTSVGNPGGQ